MTRDATLIITEKPAATNEMVTNKIQATDG